MFGMNDEFRKRQERFEQAVRDWVVEAAEYGPPPTIERAVLQQIDQLETARRSRNRWVLAGAIAAALAIAWTGGRRPDAPGLPTAAAIADQPFVALPYVVQASQNERTEVVRVNVPVAELIAVGIPVEGYPGGQAEADVLVGQDGRARAVRLLAITE
jgi:hypothetical protein